jgi:hypothetical protein
VIVKTWRGRTAAKAVLPHRAEVNAEVQQAG